MKPTSAKAKGRIFQQWTRDKILEAFPFLTDLDVRSTSMGAGGTDIQLSSAAVAAFSYKVECKSLAACSVYRLYEQATSHKAPGEPLLILKANRKRPLAVVDAEHFINLQRELHEARTSKT